MHELFEKFFAFSCSLEVHDINNALHAPLADCHGHAYLRDMMDEKTSKENKMLAQERRQHIYEHIEARGIASVRDLARRGVGGDI
jgi:hypothetical protein